MSPRWHHVGAALTRFYLTGRVTVEGEVTLDQTALPGRQGRLCLVKLVLERHRPVPTDELADALWGSEPPSSVDTSLRAVLSKVRAALARIAPDGEVELVADGGCYHLRSPGAWVDVEEAANAIDRAEGAARTGDLPGAWSHATIAAAIARRPLLPGEDAPWVAAAQGRLRGTQVRALTVLADVYRERGDHALAISLARDLVTLDPFREASHRALIAAHLADGDRAEAVRAYQACRELLAEELGIDPSPQTQALHRVAVAGAPTP